jgi:hypothetical protein
MAKAQKVNKMVRIRPPVVVQGKFVDYANALREQPGRWAMYPGGMKSPTGTLCHLENNSSVSFPAGEFEFRIVGNKVHVRASIEQ